MFNAHLLWEQIDAAGRARERWNLLFNVVWLLLGMEMKAGGGVSDETRWINSFKWVLAFNGLERKAAASIHLT